MMRLRWVYADAEPHPNTTKGAAPRWVGNWRSRAGGMCTILSWPHIRLCCIRAP